MPKVDIKKLIIEELKKEGLDLAEETAVTAVKAIFNIIPAIVAATDNKIDDMLVPVLGLVKPQIMALLDKIDGEDDAGR